MYNFIRSFDILNMLLFDLFTSIHLWTLSLAWGKREREFRSELLGNQGEPVCRSCSWNLPRVGLGLELLGRRLESRITWDTKGKRSFSMNLTSTG